MSLYNLLLGCLLLLVCLKSFRFVCYLMFHLAPPDPQSILVLNCLVLGYSRNHIFKVNIAKTESVSSLKEAIKEKKDNLFNRVDADNLILWNVSEVADLNLEKPLQKANFSGKDSLSPLEKLLKVFSNSLVEDRLHVVVGRAEYGKLVLCVI